MNLLDTLSAGVRGAKNGTAVVYLRGTTTAATVYASLAGSVRRWGTLALDSHGSVEAYVNALVDVLVYDSSGTLVRSFTEGSSDRAVEVISPSFTGQDYATSASAVSEPTTLERVLSKVKTSFGTTDFNVLVGTSSLTLTSALAGMAGVFYVVTDATFAAEGDGTTDDTAAIQKAVDTADAEGGGIVFFPPGTYLTSDWIYVPPTVSLMGAGSNVSIVKVNNAGKGVAEQTGVFNITAAGDYGPHVIERLNITATATTGLAAYAFGLVQTGDSATGSNVLGCNLVLRDCRLGALSGATGCDGAGLWVGGNAARSDVLVERCEFQAGGVSDGSYTFGKCIQSSEAVDARIDVKGCRFITPVSAPLYTVTMVQGLCTHVRASYFDHSPLENGTLYDVLSTISGVAGVYTNNSVEGCFFSDDAGGGASAAAVFGYLSTSADWFYEAGNFAGASEALFAAYPLSEAAGSAWGTVPYYCKRASRAFYEEMTAAASANINISMNVKTASVAVDCAAALGSAIIDTLVRPYSSTVAIGASLVVYGFGAMPANTDLGGGGSFGEPADYSEDTSPYRYALPGIDPTVGSNRWAYTMRFMRRPSNLTAAWLCTAVGCTSYGDYAAGTENRKSY